MHEYALSLDFKKQKEWSKPAMWLEMSFGGIAGGLFIASFMAEFALGLMGAVLVMLIGKGLLLLADLGRPLHFLNVLNNPKQSWISKGAWGFTLFAVTGIVCAMPLILKNLPWTPWSGGGKLLGIFASVMAAFIMIYDGFLLGDSKGVPFWRNSNLPLMFFFSAASGGAGALMSLAPIGGLVLDTKTPAVINLAILAISAMCLYSGIKFAVNGERGAQRSAEMLIRGSLSSVFWFGSVAVGIVIPFCVALIAVVGISLPQTVWILAGLMEIIGVFSLRYCVLKAGVYSPVL